MDKIVEQKIKEAIRNGEFEDLPGFGKPLPEEDMRGPAHMRMANKILKNANVLPGEMQLLKDADSLKQKLKACTDFAEREELKREILHLQTEYRIAMEKHKLKGKP